MEQGHPLNTTHTWVPQDEWRPEGFMITAVLEKYT